MAEQIKGLVQHRDKTYSTHASENKVLFKGELSIESDSKLLKVGDGVTPYVSLPYVTKELVTEEIVKQTTCGVMVPAYVYPTDIYNNAEYKTLIDIIKANEDVPFIVIINANSGPGTVVDTNYAGAIELLKGAGATVIGYIYTLYGTRDIQECYDDLDMWRELYPSIEGMFFDEMANEATPDLVEFYTSINRYAKGLGQNITVGNPGTLFDKDFIDTSAADIIVGWETGNYPTQEQAEDYNEGGACEYPKTRRALLIHSQGSWSETSFQFCADYFGWLYITEDLLSPNPWDSFSAYMQDMVDGIRARASADAAGIFDVLEGELEGTLAVGWNKIGYLEAVAGGTAYANFVIYTEDEIIPFTMGVKLKDFDGNQLSNILEYGKRVSYSEFGVTNITHIRMGKTYQNDTSGALIEVYCVTPVAYKIKMKDAVGSGNGWQLMAPEITDEILPDGVTPAGYLLMGSSFYYHDDINSHSCPAITGLKGSSDDEIRVSVMWPEIPAEGTSITIESAGSFLFVDHAGNVSDPLGTYSTSRVEVIGNCVSFMLTQTDISLNLTDESPLMSRVSRTSRLIINQ